MVGDEQVVAKENDRGQEVTDTGLVLVTLHQLTHPYLLKNSRHDCMSGWVSPKIFVSVQSPFGVVGYWGLELEDYSKTKIDSITNLLYLRSYAPT